MEARPSLPPPTRDAHQMQVDLKRPLEHSPPWKVHRTDIHPDEHHRIVRSGVSIDDPDVRIAAEALGDLRAGASLHHVPLK